MSVEKVRAYLTPYGVAQRIRELEVSSATVELAAGPLGMEERIREFSVSSATVELAAVAVGVEGARIAKTLSFKAGERPILVVAAGDARIDNSKYKHFFGVKAKMLTPEEAVEHIGHAVGGVCPFALPEDVSVYLDESLRRFETVFPAVGSAASAIELTCPELERSGMGFSFMEAFMDSVEVESELGKGTRVRMKKAVGKGRDIWTTQSL